MRSGLIVVVVLLLVAVAAQFLTADPGYVLLAFRDWAVETTVPILLILLILLLVAAGVLRRIRQAPRRLAEGAARAGARLTGKRVARGLAALAAGQMARAERLLARAAGKTPAPILQYLAAARLAHASGDSERRDRWFALAEKEQPEARDAVSLERAELHLHSGEQSEAQRCLEEILERQPRHLHALRLVIPLNIRRGDWAEAGRRLKALRKHGQAAAADAARWTVEAYTGRLGASEDVRNVRRIWGEIPKSLRSEERLVLARARALMRHGAHDQAEQELRRRLDAGWSSELAAAYGEIEPRDITAAIRQAETWLAEHPQDARLLLSLGRLCRKARLWGKARSYLESGLSLNESPRGWLELAEMLEELNEKPAADAAFRKGLRARASERL